MRLLPILMLCTVLSCGRPAEKPDGLIPEDKMTRVVWDMMRADQFLTDFVFSRDTSVDKLSESLRLYNRIFEIHKISKQDFLTSFAYYRDTRGALKAILDSVSNRPNTSFTAPAAADSTGQNNAPRPLPNPRDLKAE